PFNLLGLDQRKENPKQDPFMSRDCDLQAVGYRILDKKMGDETIQVLQVGMKTYEAMTTWNMCELTVLIDTNGDQIPDQELAAVQLGNIKGISSAANENMFASLLLDAGKTRALRLEFEEKSIAGPVDEKLPEENYSSAVVDMLP